jgi:Na+-translocating ferredoxin:NAD+ oxidoreductase RnfD subunit
MTKPVSAPDPRWFQVIFQSIFLLYGILFLGWTADWLHYTISMGGCLLVQYIIDSVYKKRILTLAEFDKWGFSVLISAMSLCLLLKTNHWYISLLAATLSVGSKYLFRVNGKHIFNPSAFGIVAVLVLTDKAWLSPGQWGSNAVIFFLVVTLGTIVITRVQRLDISVAFLLTFVALLYARQVLYLQWPPDFFIHSVSTGSLLLFTFFMISDPKTAPQHPVARITWAVLIAVVAFYLSVFKWKYNTLLYVLVGAAPLVPVLNYFFKGRIFEWNNPARINYFSLIKRITMKPFVKKAAAVFLLALLMTHDVLAFCGFYVAKADGTLKNKTSQVILVRDGNRNVITMYNDYKGSLKDFAMIVPVPVVLQKKDIKVVDQSIFNILNDYSKPRLVEYYDENPCQPARDYEAERKMDLSGALSGVVVMGNSVRQKKTVTIEAQYIVGEYDILILSAKESTGLKNWLTENGYKIPQGAEEVLDPYIKSNLKFFVVKVNEKEKKKVPGDFLRPLQIRFNSPKFMLPIRLGMANGDGDQDMIVYAFTKKGRIECTNYRSVEVPTGKDIPLFIQQNFGAFYSNLFQHQWHKQGRSVAMLEYAWDVSPKNFVKCDPCVGNPPTQQDLVQAGVWWVAQNWNDYEQDEDNFEYNSSVYFTRLHVRYNRKDFPQDLTFQVTPNTENFQARYIITHPATGDLSCEKGKHYLKTLKERRKNELSQLTYLTGKTYENWDMAYEEGGVSDSDAAYAALASGMGDDNNDNPLQQPFGLYILGLAGIGLLFASAKLRARPWF